MNIFCNPRITKWTGLQKLLNIDTSEEIEFGWNPSFENEDRHRTEIDMKIGARIFESKLVEDSFYDQKKIVVERYANFHDVFDSSFLQCNETHYYNYQLIRNILTAYTYNYSFSILVDRTRTDLIRSLLEVVKAIKDPQLRKHISFFTWQEIANVCGAELREYLEKKYF